MAPPSASAPRRACLGGSDDCALRAAPSRPSTPSLLQRLARFLLFGGKMLFQCPEGARIGPVAGEGTGTHVEASLRSAKSLAPPRRARRGPSVQGGCVLPQESRRLIAVCFGGQAPQAWHRDIRQSRVRTPAKPFWRSRRRKSCVTWALRWDQGRTSSVLRARLA